MSETKITKSCGCVFCDLGLKTDGVIDGKPIHSHRKGALGYSFCTNPEITREQIMQELADQAQELGMGY